DRLHPRPRPLAPGAVRPGTRGVRAPLAPARSPHRGAAPQGDLPDRRRLRRHCRRWRPRRHADQPDEALRDRRAGRRAGRLRLVGRSSARQRGAGPRPRRSPARSRRQRSARHGPGHLPGRGGLPRAGEAPPPRPEGSRRADGPPILALLLPGVAGAVADHLASGSIRLQPRSAMASSGRRDGSFRAAGGAPMSGKLAIEEVLADPQQAGRFLETHRFPLVEGTHVTVIWVGQADGVSLRHWIYGLESSTALARVPGTDLWFLTLEIPPASRVEYKLEIQRGGNSEWVEDPLNPNRARDPFGANSVLQTPGYEPPPWTSPDPVARPGSLEPLSLESQAFGGTRGGAIYLPARFRRSRQYALLVVHDGSDYLNYASMKTVLDNLIHSLAIPDLIVAFTDSP